MIYEPAFALNQEIENWLAQRQTVKLSASEHEPRPAARPHESEPAVRSRLAGHEPLPRLNPETHLILIALVVLARDGRPPGRQDILRYCRENGVSLTEQQLRERLRRLQALQLVQSRRGFGTVVTEAGLGYLTVKA
jgi:hypothetical protein